MLVRCTQRLLKGSRVAPDPDPPAPSTPLGEWYANAVPLPFAGRWVVLYVHAATLLAVVVPGRTLQGTRDGFRTRLAALLERIGLPKAWIEQQAQELAHVTVARTANRQILGYMTDMAGSIDIIAHDRRSFAEVDFDELERQLANTPYGSSHGEGRWPANDLRTLAGLPRTHRGDSW